MKTAKLCSSCGHIVFDIDTGFVVEDQTDIDFDLMLAKPGEGKPVPYKIDIDEWRLRYPGESMEGEHDILDFGLWCYRAEDGKPSPSVVYEGPAEDWRREREAMLEAKAAPSAKEKREST